MISQNYVFKALIIYDSKLMNQLGLWWLSGCLKLKSNFTEKATKIWRKLQTFIEVLSNFNWKLEMLSNFRDLHRTYELLYTEEPKNLKTKSSNCFNIYSIKTSGRISTFLWPTQKTLRIIEQLQNFFCLHYDIF